MSNILQINPLVTAILVLRVKFPGSELFIASVEQIPDDVDFWRFKFLIVNKGEKIVWVHKTAPHFVATQENKAELPQYQLLVWTDSALEQKLFRLGPSAPRQVKTEMLTKRIVGRKVLYYHWGQSAGFSPKVAMGIATVISIVNDSRPDQVLCEIRIDEAVLYHINALNKGQTLLVSPEDLALL